MNQKDSHELSVNSQQQMALDIFNTMDLVDAPITQSDREFLFRKPKLLVDVSDLGLLARRALNGCYFLAASDPNAENHVVDLRFFKWIIRYASNNNAHLKKVLREAQKSAVQVQVYDESNPNDDTWVSVRMIGDVGIGHGRVSFEIPKRLRRQLEDPERYSLLGMKVLAGFTSVYSLELYERLTEYRQEKATPWYGLDEFRGLIRVENLKIANDFRYFKRDILSPAIEEINSISDIEVTLELRRTGRFYTHLRFFIKESNKHRLVSDIPSSKKLYDTLTGDFGLCDAELEEITKIRETFGDDRVIAAIKFVEHRLATQKIIYPGKYLMQAVRDGYRIGAIEAETRSNELAKLREKSEIAAKTKAVVTKARDAKPKISCEIPKGVELQDAWDNFLNSPSARLFKSIPTNYEDATARIKKAFEGFLSSQ